MERVNRIVVLEAVKIQNAPNKESLGAWRT
jgi:hypothetical protein